MAAVVMLPSPARAINYYWDLTPGNNQIDAGSGTWSITDTNWTYGSTGTSNPNLVWPNSSSYDANFAGASAAPGTYVITVPTSLRMGNLYFYSSGYTLTSPSATTIVLAGGSLPGIISVAAGASANIGDGMTLVCGTATGGGNAMNLKGSGTLTISSSLASAPAVIKEGQNNNVNVTDGITVVVGTNGVLQSALTTNGGTGDGAVVVGLTASNATLTVNGGTVNFKNLIVGNTTATGVSTVNIENGTVAGSVGSSIIGFGASGATNTSGTGILNLDGGLLGIGGISVRSSGASAYFVNFNGSVVKATQSTTNFMAPSALLTAKVMQGGAVFDTNGYNITVGQALVSGTANDGGLVKQGEGILTLGGTNTYTGVTAIKSGTLAVAASGNISNTVALGGSNGVVGVFDVSLKGSNYIQSNIWGNGSITGTANSTIAVTDSLAPGVGAAAGIGSLNVSSNFTLAGTAFTAMEIAGNGGRTGVDFDYLTVNGLLTYGGSLVISSYGGYDLTKAGSYDLFDFGSKSGDFSSVTVNGVVLSLTSGNWTDASGMYSFNETDGVLSVTPVPEPATYVILAAGVGMLGLLRRKLARD